MLRRNRDSFCCQEYLSCGECSVSLERRIEKKDDGDDDGMGNYWTLR